MNFSIKEYISNTLTENDNLFKTVSIVFETYNIVPTKKHYGIYIDYEDIKELRDDFLYELVDSIVDWVYSKKKYQELYNKEINNNRSSGNASSKIIRKAKAKFRENKLSEKCDEVKGQFGELLLFHFIERIFRAVPLLRKMCITTSPKLERNGADAIHYKWENNKNILILGEAKTYTSSFNKAFSEAIKSILKTYDDIRNEINLYVCEDFLEDEMNEIAYKYINNELKDIEVHLVALVIFEESKELISLDRESIKKEIEDIIKDRYDKFPNNKIDVKINKILTRITYIIFPVWKLNELLMAFKENN